MNDGLADQHSIEGIPVEGRQPRDVKRRFLVDRQFGDAMRFALGRYEYCRWLGQTQTFTFPFDGDFPRRRARARVIDPGNEVFLSAVLESV